MYKRQALTNALKHSGADEVILDFIYKEHSLNVSCIDDGKGFSEAQIKTNNGVQYMQKRAQKIGGTLEIISIIGKGTKVVFTGKTT